MAVSDFTNGPAIRLTRFFMMFAGFWIWHDKRSKILMDMAMIYTICAIIVAWVITGLDLWHSRRDLSQGAYAACNATTVLIILIKLTIFTIRRKSFMGLIQFCYVNFWLCEYDSYGESVVRNCEKRCVVFVCTFTFFAQCTVVSYMMRPIIDNIGKNETDRILPFNIWLDFPITSTPYYEIMFFIEVCSLFHSGICYFCFDNLLCIMNVHVAGQFRILQRRLETMCDAKKLKDYLDSSEKPLSKDDYDRYSPDTRNIVDQYAEFKDCMRKHQTLIRFTKMVDDVYTYVILCQVVVFSLLICLVSYQAVLAEGKMTSRTIFIVHSLGTFTELFMLTLTCDGLMHESQAVADAAYRARWYINLSSSMARNFAKDIVLVIVRSNRPCSLSAGGFFPVSLETFTTIISTSMSYLTLLRQGLEEP